MNEYQLTTKTQKISEPCFNSSQTEYLLSMNKKGIFDFKNSYTLIPLV